MRKKVQLPEKILATPMIFTSAKEVLFHTAFVCLSVCLFVCLSVNSFRWKLQIRSSWKFDRRGNSGRGRTAWIFVSHPPPHRDLGIFKVSSTLRDRTFFHNMLIFMEKPIGPSWKVYRRRTCGQRSPGCDDDDDDDDRLGLAIVPLCHGTGTTSLWINTGGPFEKNVSESTCPHFKVFCALVVTVKACVMTVTTKKVVKFFLRKKSASLRKTCVMRATTTKRSAADGTAPKTPPVRLWMMTTTTVTGWWWC